jgi:low temperature requirement protein LtrA
MSHQSQRILSDNSVETMKFRSEHRVLHRLSNPFVSSEEVRVPKEIYAELFYDLFFVAALTTFGIRHEITQEQAIATYVSFFTILW